MVSQWSPAPPRGRAGALSKRSLWHGTHIYDGPHVAFVSSHLAARVSLERLWEGATHSENAGTNFAPANLFKWEHQPIGADLWRMRALQPRSDALVMCFFGLHSAPVPCGLHRTRVCARTWPSRPCCMELANSILASTMSPCLVEVVALLSLTVRGAVKIRVRFFPTVFVIQVQVRIQVRTRAGFGCGRLAGVLRAA